MRCWIALHICTFTEAGPWLPDEGAARRAVASLALGFTPRVALVDEAVLMDVTGSLRLFGGLARLMAALQAQTDSLAAPPLRLLRAQGATSLIALGRLRVLASRPDTARAAPRPRVADLPLHTLSAARPHLGVLERVGCRTWDDLLRLPRDGVARRFGAGLLDALDRARGRAPDDHMWLVLPEHFEEKLELDALVTHAPALMAGAERLLVSLHAWLLGRQSGISALMLVWHLDKRRDVPPTGELGIRTAQPAQDLRHVTRLIAEHLAREQLPAPVHSLTLRSLATESLADAAAATGSLLMEARQQGDSALELIERLGARLGDEQVLAWQGACDHRPEQMQRWVSARSALGALRAILGTPDAAKGRRRRAASRLADVPRAEALYPSWLLPEPLPLATAGNSPVYQGRLVRLAGPQRLEASGWLMPGESHTDAPGDRLHPPALRDYFIYRSEQAGLLWIYSERLTPGLPEARARRAWFLHGFFA